MNKPSIDGIQYLRAVAALMVVGHHALNYFPVRDGWTSFGETGVDIFFVISGFVMALSTRRFDAGGDRGAQAGAFLLNRFVRVVPLYWLALLWSYKHLTEPVALYAMDFAFLPRWNEEQHMLAPGFVPGWTINYEMFFYLLFAAAMLWGRWRFAVMALVLSGLVALRFLQPTSPAGLFLTSSVLLEFLYGIGVYFLLPKLPQVHKGVLLAIAATCLAALTFKPDVPRGLYWGPLATIVVATVVMAAQGIKLRVLGVIGDASYSIYLFHIATMNQTGRLCHRIGLEGSSPATIVAVVLIHLVVATLLGLLVHRVVEKPLLEWLRRRWLSRPVAAPTPVPAER